MGVSAYGKTGPRTRIVWFSNMKYHATAGTRAAIAANVTLKKGYSVCYDPTADAELDGTETVSGGIVGLDAEGKGLFGNVTIPDDDANENNNLLYAGVIVGFLDNKDQDSLVVPANTGAWVEIAVEGLVEAYCDTNTTLGLALAPLASGANSDDGFALTAVDQATLANAFVSTVAMAAEVDASLTATTAKVWVNLLGVGGKPADS